MLEARRSGERARAKELADEHTKLVEELTTRAQRQIADDPSPEVDHDLARQYMEITERLAGQNLYRERARLLAPRLGQVRPADASAGASAEPAIWATSAYARPDGATLRIEFLWLADPGAGIEAVIRWLDSKGCRSIRYEVKGETEYDGDPDE